MLLKPSISRNVSVSPTDCLLGYVPAASASSDPTVSVTTVKLTPHASVVRLDFSDPFERIDVRSALLGLECRARSVQCRVPKVVVRSYRFAATEAGELLPTANHEHPTRENIRKSDVLTNSDQTKIRYSLPRDSLHPQDRLLLVLQPPAPAIFRQRRLPLPAKPYSYQWEGVAFLLPRRSALLADEMGLGKTIQAILSLRLLFHLGEINHALIVCPKPLVSNWLKEFHKWATEIPVDTVTGDSLFRQHSWSGNTPVKITNYEVITRDVAFLVEKKIDFDLVILDEAQRIKNPQSKTAQAVSLLRRKRSWALTGTPIENSLYDLYSIFHFVKPAGLPSGLSVPEVREFVRDYFIRRTKDQVAADLPAKIYRDLSLELGPNQASSYQLAKREGVVWLRRQGRQVTIKHILALLQRLKQICNFDPVTQESAKLEQLTADLDEVAASCRKAIVFSQWVETLQHIAERFPELNPVLFHGQMSTAQRLLNLRRFQEDPTCRLILMTYGSGGVGLNLQCANYVFLFDRWWNPAIEDQAIHRAHRIGQTQPVVVTRYITKDTIESKIEEILERKRALFHQIIGQSINVPPVTLAVEDLFHLFDVSPQNLEQSGEKQEG